MAEANLFCDHANCSEPAAKFVFAQGATKTKACFQHTCTLLSEELYNISAYHFAQSPGDATVYECRVELVRKGVGNIEELKGKCLKDLEIAEGRLKSAKEKVLDIVERSFREMVLRTQERCGELIQLLELKRGNIEKLVQEKRFQLSAADTALCGNVPPASLFCMVLGDCVVPVTEALMGSFYILPFKGSEDASLFASSAVMRELKSFLQEEMEKGRTDIAAETGKYVQELSTEDLPDFLSILSQQQRKSAKKLVLSLPRTASETEVLKVAEQYSQRSAEARNIGNYELSLKRITKGRAVLQQWGCTSPAVSLEEGTVFTHFAKWQEAETVLRHGLEEEMRARHDSQLAVQLSNALAMSFLQAGQWDEAEELCQWTLRTWEHTEYQFELLSARFVLYSSFKWIYSNIYNIKESQWSNNVKAETPCCQWLLECIRIIEDDPINNDYAEEAIQGFREAIELGQQLLPSSYFITLAIRWLIHICDNASGLAIHEFQLRAPFFQVHFPRSFDFVYCISKLGHRFRTLHQRDQEERLWLQAAHILDAYFPSPAIFPLDDDWEELDLEAIYPILVRTDCHFHLAELYQKSDRLENAEEQYLQLYQICSQYGPESRGLESILKGLGEVHERQGKREEAVRELKAALYVYTEKKDKSAMAECQQALKRLDSYQEN